MQIEEDVIHRDLHNPSHRTTAEFNGFIVHSKYFSVLKVAPLDFLGLIPPKFEH